MDVMVENLARMTWKTKLNLRSGFWQVSLTRRAAELTSFVTQSGRIFRWRCMPLGLQGAPGISQELMEQICEQSRKSLMDNFPQI